MKILLINPNFSKKGYNNCTPPLGIALLYSILKENNINCDVIDPIPMFLKRDDIKNKIKKENYDIVGISVLTENRFEAEELIKDTKEINSETITVAGGPHVSFLDKLWLEKIKECDIVVRNEAEYSFLDICKNKELKDIGNITYRKNGNIIRTKPRRYIKNLGILPFISFEKFPLDNYEKFLDVPKQYSHLKQIGIITSRGCPFNCLFCSSPKLFGSFWRGMTPQRVVDEIENLKEKYKIGYIRFFDDNFIHDINRVIEICREIKKRNLDIIWRCESRADSINEKLCNWLSKAGCHEIEIGVETAEDKILNSVIGKKIKIVDVIKAVEACKKYNIKTKGFFVIGLPYQTKKLIETSMKLSSIFDYIGVSLLSVYPGSRLWEKLKKEGKWNDEFWFNKSKPDCNIYEEVWNIKELEEIRNTFHEYHMQHHPN